eukprot:2283843-Prymnesium_polylepis.2
MHGVWDAWAWVAGLGFFYGENYRHSPSTAVPGTMVGSGRVCVLREQGTRKRRMCVCVTGRYGTWHADGTRRGVCVTHCNYPRHALYCRTTVGRVGALRGRHTATTY